MRAVKRILVPFYPVNLWLTLGLWSSRVLFISELASCLPGVIYHNLSVNTSTTASLLRITGQHRSL